ncbi:MAG: hypothetical protein KDD28_30055 [Phaeodactylibacter sp.]|nr:hypothetical protein [Phaeodactylibacter sp.]
MKLSMSQACLGACLARNALQLPGIQLASKAAFQLPQGILCKGDMPAPVRMAPLPAGDAFDLANGSPVFMGKFDFDPVFSPVAQRARGDNHFHWNSNFYFQNQKKLTHNQLFFSIL